MPEKWWFSSFLNLTRWTPCTHNNNNKSWKYKKYSECQRLYTIKSKRLSERSRCVWDHLKWDLVLKASKHKGLGSQTSLGPGLHRMAVGLVAGRPPVWKSAGPSWWFWMRTQPLAAGCLDASIHHFLLWVVPGFSLEEAHLEDHNTQLQNSRAGQMWRLTGERKGIV